MIKNPANPAACDGIDTNGDRNVKAGNGVDLEAAVSEVARLALQKFGIECADKQARLAEEINFVIMTEMISIVAETDARGDRRCP